jgi:hypothetical protein
MKEESGNKKPKYQEIKKFYKLKNKWWNWHNTRNVGGKFETIFEPSNKYRDGSKSKQPFAVGMAGLKAIVNKAGEANKKIRVFGSRWSLNDIAYSEDYMIMTHKLNELKIGLEEQHVDDAYKTKNDQLVFVQCGVKVKDLNKKIEKEEISLALPTTGASDGQLFAGSVSTGTHGAAQSFGAMADYVKGIHLVTLEDKLVFLQRASDPVVNQDFCDWLGNTNLRVDDDLFNAALVGFGSFGVIHGLLIKAEPLYKLRKFVKQYSYEKSRSPNYHDEIRELMKDPSGQMPSFLSIPKAFKTKVPYHFEVVINPYYKNAKRVDNPVFVRMMFKEDPSVVTGSSDGNGPPMGGGPIGADYNNDVVNIFQNLGEYADKEEPGLGGAVSKGGSSSKKGRDIGKLGKRRLANILQLAMRDSIHETKEGKNYIVGKAKPPGQQFCGKEKDYSKNYYTGASLEIGIPRKSVLDALDLLIEVVNKEKNYFAAPIAFRYVKKSTAMLAFTRYEDTVTIEMPGLDDLASDRGHKAIFEAFETSNIPHTYHWGQNFPKNKKWVEKSYDKETVDLWKKKRSELLGEKGCRIFSNGLINKLGLDDYIEKDMA